MALPPRVQRLLAGRPVIKDGQTLAVETQLYLRVKQLIKDPAVESLPTAEARRQMLRETTLAGGNQPIGSVRELEVEGAAGPLAARLYIPRADSDALLVYF